MEAWTLVRVGAMLLGSAACWTYPSKRASMAIPRRTVRLAPLRVIPARLHFLFYKVFELFPKRENLVVEVCVVNRVGIVWGPGLRVPRWWS